MWVFESFFSRSSIHDLTSILYSFPPGRIFSVLLYINSADRLGKSVILTQKAGVNHSQSACSASKTDHGQPQSDAVDTIPEHLRDIIPLQHNNGGPRRLDGQQQLLYQDIQLTGQSFLAWCPACYATPAGCQWRENLLLGTGGR